MDLNDPTTTRLAEVEFAVLDHYTTCRRSIDAILDTEELIHAIIDASNTLWRQVLGAEPETL